MKHVFYAVFPTDKEAAAAIAAVKELGVPDEDFSIVVHRDAVRDPEDLELNETDGLTGVVDGAILGAIAGVLTVTVMAVPMGLFAAGPLAVAALGAAAGTAYGALAAGLAGLGFPDHVLEKLMAHLHDGNVLVTVTADHKADERAIEAIFAAHGAIEARKHQF